MIYLFVGGVGSGKSYHALEEGLKAIAYGKKVIANFPIVKSRWRWLSRLRGEENWIYLPDEELSPHRLIEISLRYGLRGRESSGLLIIDEAGIFFNSRDWVIKQRERSEWIKFFSQSRKFGYDIIMISQDERMIDRQIREMADMTVKHLAFSAHIYLKWVEWLFFKKLRFFFAVYFWRRTTFRGLPKIVILKPWVAGRYDTMALFKYGEGLGAEKGEKKEQKKAVAADGGG